MLSYAIKNEFPIFKRQKNWSYLDSAATTQTCADVIKAMDFYYTERRANVHRGIYQMSGLATKLYEDSRDTVADFIGARDTEVVFTSGVTHGLNMLAYSLCTNLKQGDNIVLTRLEHHANLIPWQQMSKRYGFSIRFIELTKECGLEISDMPIDENTKIVSLAHISNAIGTLAPVKNIFSAATKAGAITILDAAQSIAHQKIDVKELECDFLLFSGHKVYGPTGIGVLWGKHELLEKIEPFFYGGEMIKKVTYESATWNDLPWKFEAGTPNIAGVVGLSAALRFIQRIGLGEIGRHEQDLGNLTVKNLSNLSGIRIIGRPEFGAPISFVVEGVHPHDVASILDSHGVAVRAGHHCAMPLMKHLGLTGTTRVSFGIYNIRKDVDKLVGGLNDVINKFSS